MFLSELDGYAPSGGGVRGKPVLTLTELDAKFRTFLLDVYHRRDNAETKVPPIERWEANGFLPRMPESLEQLDLLLIYVAKARQVRVDGIQQQLETIRRRDEEHDAELLTNHDWLSEPFPKLQPTSLTINQQDLRESSIQRRPMYPLLLVRLSCVNRGALHDLLSVSWRMLRRGMCCHACHEAARQLKHRIRRTW